MLGSSRNKLLDAPNAFLYLAELPQIHESGDCLKQMEVGIESLSRTASAVTLAKAGLGIVYAKRIHSTETAEDLRHQISICVARAPLDQEVILVSRIVSGVVALMRDQDFDGALLMLSDVAEELRLSSNGELYGIVRRWLAVGHMLKGAHAAARIAFEDALATFRRYGMAFSYAATMNDYAFLRMTLGHYMEARELLREVMQRFECLGVHRSRVLTMTNLGIVYERVGNWTSADRCYNAALSALGDGEETTGAPQLRLMCLANIECLRVMRRRFCLAEPGLTALVKQYGETAPARSRAIMFEIMGELGLEEGDFEKAERYLGLAMAAARPSLDKSDVMTELLRRYAQLQFERGALREARDSALAGVALCQAIGDPYERGATLRVLGQIYAKSGQPKKADACFRAAANTLKTIQECYELMRTLYAQGKFFGAQTRREEAEVALLEARQLAKKLEIDYYLALIAIALIDTLGPQERFDEANAWLNEATALRDNLEGIDRERVEKELKRAAEELQVAMTRASVRSAETLKTICRVYEDARFPFEDLKPDLAYQVAQSVGGECLFIIARFGGGYRVPLTYNIAVNEAKEVVRQMDRGSRKIPLLGVDGEPRVLRTLNGKTLVAVPCQHEESARRDPASYVLCTRFEEIVTVTPRQLELLCASGDALARLIEVEEERRGAPVGENDEDTIRIKHPRGSFKDILTIDADMIKVIRMAERAAGSVAPILLEGETGVGKELFARAIHASSKRNEYPFVAINAGGLSVHLIESELFGHVKGAFTGANSDRIGFVESARGGTLFLDEIGEMSEELQVKVLRLLENGEYRRLGESAVRQAEVRVISATNRDLKKEVERAAFRRDLYYRVSPIRLVIPPLRMRSRDIQLLVRHFLRDCAALNGIADRYIEIDVKAMEALELYDWPGNVRELYNEILRVVSLIGRGDLVKFAMLSDNIKDYLKSKNRGDGLLDRSVEQYERRLLLNALDRNDWNRMRTADSVGVPRTTLLAKLKRLNVATKDHPTSP